VFSYLILEKYIILNLQNLIIGTLCSVGIGLILSQTPTFYKRIRVGRYYPIFLPFNILFQQLFVVAGIYILQMMFMGRYYDFYFGILFTLVHLPVIFLKWARLRYLYLVFTLFCGTLFSFLIRNYEFGSLVSFMVHFIVYIPLIYYLRDERKI